MPRAQVEHGTYRGYQWHRRTKTPTCRPCMDAANQYVKDYRESHPESQLRNHLQSRAYGVALRRLRDRYRGVFNRYYAEELGKAS